MIFLQPQLLYICENSKLQGAESLCKIHLAKPHITKSQPFFTRNSFPGKVLQVRNKCSLLMSWMEKEPFWEVALRLQCITTAKLSATLPHPFYGPCTHSHSSKTLYPCVSKHLGLRNHTMLLEIEFKCSLNEQSTVAVVLVKQRVHILLLQSKMKYNFIF